MNEPVQPSLTGVPETMLWTLYNRATEAARADGILRDPQAVRLHRSIAYDFERSFGEPDGSHALRARIIDDAVRAWLALHPGGTVVELGCGLETQFHRCDDGRVRWLCVDLPEAIEIREQLLPSPQRCQTLAASALEPRWMDLVEDDRGVLVTAQGLFMYLQPSDVRWLFTSIVDRFPKVELVFDAIPRWFSRKTLTGFEKTQHYTMPPMPWGVNSKEIGPLLRSWSRRVGSVARVPYGPFRLPSWRLFPVASRLPLVRELFPFVAQVTTVGDGA